jgi:DNA-binding transcriptional MerR regulator
MEYSINKLTKLSGVSTRTLRYYDEIGLLKPLRTTEGGYRVYGQEEVDTLQQILLFKTLDFSLEEIRELIYSPRFDRNQAFSNHLDELREKQKNLNLLITNVEKSQASLQENEIMIDEEKFIGFYELRDIDDEKERISKFYELFDEDSRLQSSRAARIEFITHTMLIDRYLTLEAKIADLGAGAGEYSLHYADLGYDITAVDLSPANIEAFQSKIKPEHKINLFQGDACSLPNLADQSFDMVLVFGPLYHLSNPEDRSRCIQEAKRICKKDGYILFTFINHDMIPYTETFCYNPTHFIGEFYDSKTRRVENFPFVFIAPDEAREILVNEGIEIVTAAATQGIGELMAKEINQMPAEVYDKYLDYHLHICEKIEMLGMSNHLLFVGKVK